MGVIGVECSAHSTRLINIIYIYSSAEELMKSFGGPTELPQRGGAKDYAPDGSWLQDKTLQFFYKERTQVLIEERIKKKYVL